jgi:hypothetical protein
MALDKLKYTYLDPLKVSELNVDDVLNVNNTINTNNINISGVISSAQNTQSLQNYFDTAGNLIKGDGDQIVLASQIF